MIRRLPFRVRILLCSLASRTQRSPLTRWLWQQWQHEDGSVTVLPFWRRPGRRWSKVKWED